MLEKEYGNCVSLKDNDIFVFSIMALRILTGDKFLDYGDRSQTLNKLNVDKETKEGLNIIFSDSQNKPYFSEVFRKTNPNQDLLKI